MPILQTATIRTYYEVSGQGDTLVFIHGHGSSSRDWEFQSAFFSEYFQTLCYDVRGHGKSEKPKGPYSVAGFAIDLAELLGALEIKKAHIVGLSMGGWIAFQFAVDYPEMTKSLTIVNSWADMRPKNFQDRINIFQRYIYFRLFSMRKIGEIVAPIIFIKPEQDDLRQSLIERWAENQKASYFASMKAGIGWSVADQLDNINCPVLVVAADEDYTPVAAKQAYVDKLSNARLIIIKDSRHGTPVEHPEKFNRLLLGFLQEIA